ncbi:DUF2877 domain-containing protein [Lachnospiraceae bacterium 54-53]
MRITGCVCRAAELFENESRGWVHSAYHNTVNLKVKDSLFALHPDTIPMTPLSLQTDRRESGILTAEPGQPAFFQGNVLWIGGQKITCQSPRIYDPRLKAAPGWEELHLLADAVYQVLPLYKNRQDPVLMHALEKGKGWKAQKSRIPDPAAGKYLRSLIGLGNGLTPSGDDFLSGILFFLTAAGKKGEKWLELTAEAVRDGLDETGHISREFLYRGLLGEFGEKMTALAEEGAGKGNLTQAVCRAAETGHSSGLSALLGILFSWELLKQEFPENSV